MFICERLRVAGVIPCCFTYFLPSLRADCVVAFQILSTTALPALADADAFSPARPFLTFRFFSQVLSLLNIHRIIFEKAKWDRRVADWCKELYPIYMQLKTSRRKYVQCACVLVKGCVPVHMKIIKQKKRCCGHIL